MLEAALIFVMASPLVESDVNPFADEEECPAVVGAADAAVLLSRASPSKRARSRWKKKL